MKPSAYTAVIAAMAAVIAVLLWAVVYFARDELGLAEDRSEEEVVAESAAAAKAGFAAVRVPRESQAASGLGVRGLQPVRLQASAEISGVVVDLQPLFDLRARYLTAAGQARALRAAATNSADEYRRVKGLFEDDRNVSERVVVAAEAQSRSDQARLAAADQSAAAILDALRAEWGATLAGWAVGPDQGPLKGLAEQREVLVQFTFPDELRDQAGRVTVGVVSVAGRGNPRPARFVSPAPRTDPTLRGATYFYSANADGLRVGMRVVGRVGLDGGSRDGVIVPSSAVVWHGGKPWVYVKGEGDTFVRKEVSAAEAVPEGWFDAAHFAPGDEVVVKGAQLLLSEELRFQIRNENKD